MSEYFRDYQGAAPERFLTARELAAILGVHEHYIYDRAARGLIPSYKFGGNRRFRWSEIEHWLTASGPDPTMSVEPEGLRAWPTSNAES